MEGGGGEGEGGEGAERQRQQRLGVHVFELVFLKQQWSQVQQEWQVIVIQSE